MTTLAKILIALCLSATCCSCNIAFNGIKGEGEVIRKEKSLNQDFNAVKASRGLNVILVKSKDRKVIIEANKNLHEHIEIYVKDDVLYVTSDENIYSADEKSVFVSYININKIAANSGADVTAEGAITQKKLSLSATSGADIELQIKAETLSTSATSGAGIDVSGKVNTHNASATSGADIQAENLLSLISEAKVTSGASIRIYAKNELTGKATSGGDIVYYGDPKKISETDNSGGSIQKD